MTKPNKYSEQDLKDLYQIAVEQGWDALERGERITLGKYCRTNGLPRPTVPTVAPEPQPPIPAKPAKPAPQTTVPEQKTTAPTATQTPLTDNTEIEWVDAWPETNLIIKWGQIAQQLRSHPERIAIIARNVPRRQAGDLVSSINTGKSKAWRPRGDYEAHKGVGDSPDVFHVYACYHED